jgi:hypothetical protein
MHTCILNIHDVYIKVNARQPDTIQRIEDLYNLFLLPDTPDVIPEFELTSDDEGDLFTILAQKGMVALHAAAYENINGHGILLPGGAGSGKTTIAFSALTSGYPFIGDDVILCHYNGEGFNLLPFKSYLHLKQNSKTQKYNILEHYPREIFCKTYAKAIVFPRITTDGVTTIKKFNESRKTTFIKLLKNCVWVKDAPLRKKQASLLEELCTLPVYDLFLGSDHKKRQQLAIELLDGI